MIDEQLAKRIKRIETAISDLSQRVGALEGESLVTPEDEKAQERADYEERMQDIPRAFWREQVDV